MEIICNIILKQKQTFIFFVYMFSVELKELHERKVKDIVDKKQILNLPLIDKEANIDKVFTVLSSTRPCGRENT